MHPARYPKNGAIITYKPRIARDFYRIIKHLAQILRIIALIEKYTTINQEDKN